MHYTRHIMKDSVKNVGRSMSLIFNSIPLLNKNKQSSDQESATRLKRFCPYKVNMIEAKHMYVVNVDFEQV